MMARSKAAVVAPFHTRLLTRAKAGTLRSVCQRARTARANSASADKTRIVGWSKFVFSIMVQVSLFSCCRGRKPWRRGCMYFQGSRFALLYDPVSGFVDKARGHRGLPIVIVQRHHPGIRVERAVGVAQPNFLGEFQGQLTGKQGFPGCAEFNDRRLRSGFYPSSRADAYRNSHRGGV